MLSLTGISSPNLVISPLYVRGAGAIAAVAQSGWFAGSVLVPFELPCSIEASSGAVAVGSSFWVLGVLLWCCPEDGDCAYTDRTLWRFSLQFDLPLYSSPGCICHIFVVSSIIWVSFYPTLFEIVKGECTQISKFRFQCTNVSRWIEIPGYLNFRGSLCKV